METKECTKCRVVKALTDFEPSYDKRCKNPGRRSDCRECRNKYKVSVYPRNSVKLCANARAWRKKNPDKLHHQNLMSRFNISYQNYLDAFAAQGNVCDICKLPNTTNKRYPVDHCHVTGKIRSILCHYCNAGLGYFKDNPELLVLAAEYLKKHENRSEQLLSRIGQGSKGTTPKTKRVS